MAPVRHLIRGRIITESSGASPPGDPMDESDEDPLGSSESGRTQAVEPLVASTSKSPVKEKLEPETTEEMPRRQFACKSVKMTVSRSDSQKSDWEVDFQQDKHDDSLSHSEESHITEISSARTSLDRGGGRDFTAVELLKIFGERTCECCHRRYNPKRARYFKQFCRNRCAKLFAEELSAKKVRLSRKSAALPLRVRRQTRDSPASESYSEQTSVTSGAPSRKSGRLRRRPYALCETDGDESSSDSAAPTTSSRSQSSGGAKGKAIRLIKIEPHLRSYRPSPEIPCTLSPTLPSRSVRTKSALPKRAASNRIPHPESGEIGQKRPRLNSRYMSPQARQFINEKSEYVKTLIMEKPVVTWDFSEVAAFAESLGGGGGGGLATVILTTQVDGQCLLLFDDAETWQNGFGLSAAKAKKIVREVQMLELVQRESTLKDWYDDRPRQFAAAIKYLGNSSKS